ncbi:hypothetical protein [Nonomuraea sp. GTA35]|uniref:hypothetical protein n=1 Tax=Nonomuraea sp. GTA35 TaxID=1676746 RepID=UPI0035BEE22A
MTRSSRKPRRLVVGDETFLWVVAHNHRDEQGRLRECRETLRLRRSGARGRLLIVFQKGPGRLVPDGYVHSGAVGTGGLWLNLHEPGTVRALLDEVTRRGWDSDDPRTSHLDGWDLFAAAATRLTATAPPPAEQVRP